MKTKEAYRRYLLSEHWRHLRLQALIRDGYHCSRCPQTHHLEVHHRLYRDRWQDAVLADLETLCSVCHEREHRPKVPDSPVFGVAGSIGGRRWNVLGQAVTGNGVPISNLIQKHKNDRNKARNKARKKWLQRRRRGSWSC